MTAGANLLAAALLASAAEQDVSGQVEGVLPVLRADRCNLLTCFDENTRQPEGSKLRI